MVKLHREELKFDLICGFAEMHFVSIRSGDWVDKEPSNPMHY